MTQHLQACVFRICQKLDTMSEQKDKPGKPDQGTRKEKEIKEPFRPEDTPRPPQVMDTSKAPEEQNDEKSDPAEKETGTKKRAD